MTQAKRLWAFVRKDPRHSAWWYACRACVSSGSASSQLLRMVKMGILFRSHNGRAWVYDVVPFS